VGPDLTSANNRPDDAWLDDILRPGDRITVGFHAYAVVTRSGEVFTGVLAAETATSITLRREKGAEETILRNDIQEMTASSQSLMPDNMEAVISPPDLANVLAYLREAFGPAPPSKVVLFDDEPSFVDSLTEGGGGASLAADDPFSGKASLAVTPPQRYSGQIPGWRYRIAESPGPGEFRYLRWAWKCRGGDGAMIELASRGAWPAPESPERRYYSGKNTTAWKAREVSADPPAEWTVVVVDLWKDCGELILTGIAPTAMGGEARLDRIELSRTVEEGRP
jgi:putative heme-binding domain-containing protein